MKNNPLYIQLKDIALTGNYTVQQAKDLTFNQAASLLGTRDFSGAFLNNAKRAIIMALENRDDEAVLQEVKSKVKTWLDANHPDWIAEKGRLRGKPYITIYLEGFP